MALDPSIALGVKPLEIANPVTQYMQAAQLQGTQMQLDTLKRERDTLDQIRAKSMEHGGPADLNEIANAYINSGDPKFMEFGIGLHQKLKDQSLYDNYLKSQGVDVNPAPTNAMAPAPAAPVNNLPSVVGGGAAPVVGGGAAPVRNAMTPQPINAMAPNEQQILNNIRMLSASGDPRAKAEVDVLKAQLAEVRKIPTEVREFQYAQSNPEFEKYQTRLKRAGGVNVNLPAQEKAFESELGKGQADAIIKSRVGAQDAASILQTNEVGRQILNSGAITGAGADFFIGLNQALKTAGVDAGYADAAANSQAYAATMAANTGKLIKQFGAGTGLSDSDKAYATKAAAGEITMDVKAIRKVLDINDRAARNVITSHNKSVKGIKTNVPLEVEMPAEVKPAAMQPIAAPPAAIEYLKANPAMKAAFEAKYGAGSADRVLKGQ
jgi:hypothetical protein